MRQPGAYGHLGFIALGREEEMSGGCRNVEACKRSLQIDSTCSIFLFQKSFSEPVWCSRENYNLLLNTRALSLPSQKGGEAEELRVISAWRTLYLFSCQSPCAGCIKSNPHHGPSPRLRVFVCVCEIERDVCSRRLLIYLLKVCSEDAVHQTV